MAAGISLSKSAWFAPAPRVLHVREAQVFAEKLVRTHLRPSEAAASLSQSLALSVSRSASVLGAPSNVTVEGN